MVITYNYEGWDYNPFIYKQESLKLLWKKISKISGHMRRHYCNELLLGSGKKLFLYDF